MGIWRRDVEAGGGLVQEAVAHKQIEQLRACRRVHLPESAGLNQRHPQSRHFQILAPYPRKERFERSRSADALLFVGHVVSLGRSAQGAPHAVDTRATSAPGTSVGLANKLTLT